MNEKIQKIKSKPLVFMGVIILVIIIVSYSIWKKSRSSKVTYKQITIERGDLGAAILSTGIVQPENRLEIKPPIPGRAERVLVDEGYRVTKGQVLVWMSSTERAAILDAARARGLEELKTWDEYYKATPVLAPINGMIIQRNIQPGQTFATADAILVMSDRLTIQAQVDETDISQIRLKQEANIVLDAYSKEIIPGHVDKIAYDAKTVNNVTTYIVDVLPNKTPDFMRSGMTANVSFLISSRKNVLYLPSEAVKKTPDGGSYVLQPSAEKSSPVEKSIEIGITDGKRTEIVSGMTEGSPVLIPQLKLGHSSGGSSPFSPFGQRKPSK